MAKLLGALLASLLLVSSAHAQPVAWKWSDDQATLKYSTQKHLPDYLVEHGKEFYCPVSIWTKDRSRLIYERKEGHLEIVFARSKDTLFITYHHAIMSGCQVIAIDLSTGKQLWHVGVDGLAPEGHDKYRNRVNIETDGERVIVYGNESFGKYVEHLDVATGKKLLKRTFSD